MTTTKDVWLNFSPPTKDAGRLSRGSAFMGDRQLASDQLLDALPDNRRDVIPFLATLNGFFALAGRRGERFFAAVDRVRSRPIFFTEHEGVLRISDDPYGLARLWGSADSKTKPEISTEFLMSGFVTGHDTLHPRVHQLSAGELLWAERHQDGYAFDIQPYFQYLSTTGIDVANDWRPHFQRSSTRDPEGVGLESATWSEQLDEVASHAVGRLVQVARGRSIVVPLSGGRDSRLLAMKLKQLAYGDVYCYSYGSFEGFEARVSRTVAERLGYPWFFARYDPNVWRRCRTDESFWSFRRRAHSLSQIECIQDWPAVRTLVDRVPPDSLFVPGHTLDFLSGSHIPGGWEQDGLGGWRSVEAAIVRRYFSLWPRQTLADVFGASSADALWADLILRVRSSVARFEAPGVAAMVQGLEHFSWIERQAKFIVNSVRVYESHGFDWWLPWWDNELLRFWRSVPLSLRFGNRLRNHFVDTYQTVFGIEAPPRPDPPRRRCSLGILSDAGRCRSTLPIRHGLKGDGGWLPLREHPLSWYSLVEPEIAAWGYSGATHVNAYLSRRYLQGVS